ncbi:MAG: glycoside hydrolase family 3 C-terminal domain-containing protein, partial [Armatimonadota bacterium]
GGLLPLSGDVKSIAVIGPNADDHDVLLGTYNGTPSREVTALEGIRSRAPAGCEVRYAKGCEITGDVRSGFGEAVAAAEKAEVAVVVLGLHPRIEGEEGDAVDSEANGDRVHIDLPGAQEELLKAVHDTGTPVVLVLMNGSAVAINWAEGNVPAILTAWYPGEEGGTAVAEALFGDYNPAGRLPVTFYKSLDQLPAFADYRMEGHTYRYFRQEPLYPFGYGLSYTRFRYGSLRVGPERVEAGGEVEVCAEVENAGGRAGEEVVQLYVSNAAASAPVPIRQLAGFRRVSLGPGERESVRFTLTPRQMSLIDEDGSRVVEPGEFAVVVGGGQPGARGMVEGESVVGGRFEVVGVVTEVE